MDHKKNESEYRYSGSSSIYYLNTFSSKNAGKLGWFRQQARLAPYFFIIEMASCASVTTT